MSKPEELAAAVTQHVLEEGNKNGQRWHVDQNFLAALIAEHMKPAPAPAKKNAAKKAPSDG